MSTELAHPPIAASSQIATLDGIDPYAMTVVQYQRQLGSFIRSRLTAATVSLTLTGASTLALTFQDPDRLMLGSPLLTEGVTIDTGMGRGFTLVKIGKAKNQVTGTFEDALINGLRKWTGPLAAARGVWSRIGFIGQLCAQANNVPCITPPGRGVEAALVPLTRGSSQAPDEDSWTAMTRIAGDVQDECFSNGKAIVTGPDYWLLGGPPAAQVREMANGIDYVDFDYDVGKPVTTATVYTYASAWKANVGEHIRLPSMGAATGDYIVSEISRDLFHSPVTVKLVAGRPMLPEPKSQT